MSIPCINSLLMFAGLLFRPWLFASSLVLGLGLLGGFGRIIEKHCRASIVALEYFGQVDGHATQYSLITRSLLATALDHLEKREMEERSRRTESSSQLFGLLPQPSHEMPDHGSPALGEAHFAGRTFGARPIESRSPQFALDFEANIFDLAESLSLTPDFPTVDGSLGGDADQSLGAMNLFPLLENTEGHIDLANYF